MSYAAKEKLEILQRINAYELTSDGCKSEGVSRATYYRWRERFNEGGLAELEDVSRKPNSSPNVIADDVKAMVIELAKSKKYRSANSISVEMNKQGITVSRNTVIKLLAPLGLYPILYELPCGGVRRKVITKYEKQW